MSKYSFNYVYFIISVIANFGKVISGQCTIEVVFIYDCYYERLKLKKLHRYFQANVLKTAVRFIGNSCDLNLLFCKLLI
jgi:hypothetical protein